MPLHVTERALALHFLFQNPQSGIDVVIANRDLHPENTFRVLPSSAPTEKRKGSRRTGSPFCRTKLRQLRLSQIDRRGLALLPPLQFEADLLSFVQIAHAGSLDGRNVHKHILRPVLRLNEPVALLAVEPLHGSDRHRRPSEIKWPPPGRRRRVELLIVRSAGPALACEQEDNQAEPRAHRP